MTFRIDCSYSVIRSSTSHRRGEWRAEIRVRGDSACHPSLATYIDYFAALV